MARNLPSYEFDLTSGWNTKLNPRTVAGRGLLESVNVHYFEEWRSAGKIYGSSTVSPSLGAAVKSLHYFEYTDLGYQRQRDVLAVANGALRKFSSTSVWDTETLPAGATLTNEAMSEAIMNDRIHLTSSNQRGLPTGGLKFDGIRVTNWGVQAPGTEETALEALDDNTNWTASTDATLADESARTIDGGGSIKLTKTGTSAAVAYLQRGSLAHDVSAAGQDSGRVYLYIESGVLQLLEQTEWQTGDGVDAAAVEIRITASTTNDYTNSDFYTFSIGDLVPGWNLLTWVWSSPSGSTGTGIDTETTDIGSIRLQIKGNSTAAISGDQFILWDHLHIVDEGAPTLADAASGSGPDGTYTGIVTYLTEYGLESNAGPASASLTLVDNQINWTGIPVSSDNQVVARRLYRDISGDGLFRFVGQIDDNETTTFSDTVADASLGAASAPFAGDATFDNSPPGRLADCRTTESRVFGIDADNPIILKISETASPEAWRVIDQLVFEEALVGLKLWQNGVLAYATDKVFFVGGDGTFTPFNVTPFGRDMMGLNGKRAIVEAKAFNIAVQEERVSLINAPNDPWLLNGPILDQFDALTKTSLDNMFAVHDPAEFRIIFFPAGGDDAFVYQYGMQSSQNVTGEGPGVDPQDLREGIWSKLTFPTGWDAECAAVVERSADTPEVWVGGTDGYVYHLDSAATQWTNGGAAAESVSMTLETQWVPLDWQSQGQRGTTRGLPRFLRLHQNDAAGAVTYTITVTVARDPEVDNTTQITKSWSQVVTGNESLIIPIQFRGRGEWCKVKLESTSNDTPVITGLELFYVPRGVDFRGPRS